MLIHINSHFAVGMAVASILNYFYSFSFFDFILIVIFSFICDFDVFFSKYAKDHNHRMLITHSVIPSLIIILLGLIFNWLALIFSGILYFIHILIDTLDWGTDLFFLHKKPVGIKMLISKEELENLPEYLIKYKKNESFFDEKYYTNKISIANEIILFIIMMLTTIIFALEYIYIIIFYFLGLYFHLSRHFHLKKLEKQ
ncbi:MAG: hypothetical protein ACTSV5_06940 [Promethearchaeota archaeon]